MKRFLQKNYILILILAFLGVWFWSWQHAATPHNWFLENELVFIFIPVVAFLFYKTHLSKLSVTLIVIFMCLHIVGAHYNYGSVPFGITVGNAFGVHQNEYDKLVHFSFGLLILYPMYEFLSRLTKIQTFWNYIFAYNVILAWAAIYEILEWINVSNVDPQLGYLFIGGNDPFDTQKDMLMAGLGALTTIILILIFKVVHKKNSVASPTL